MDKLLKMLDKERASMIEQAGLYSKQIDNFKKLSEKAKIDYDKTCKDIHKIEYIIAHVKDPSDI